MDVKQLLDGGMEVEESGRGLIRGLGLLGIIALGVDNVIGGGINYISVQIQDKVIGIGNLLPLVMIIGGGIAFFIALNYSYLGSAMPRAGGEYVWVSRGWKGVMGFLSSFSFWLAQCAAAGAIAYFDPSFLGTFFNQIGFTAVGKWMTSPAGTLIVGLGIIWLVWLIHISSIKTVAWTSIVFMVLMFAGGFFIVYYGFATSPPAYAAALKTHGIDMHHYVEIGARHARSVQGTDFPKALFIMFFSFVGFTAMSQAAGETKNPKRTLTLAFPIVVVVITVYFVLYTAGVYHAVPWQYILGLLESGRTSMVNGPALLGYVMPKAVAAFVSLMVALALFNDLPPVYQTLTRLFYSWSMDGIIPGWAGKTNRKGVPAISITFNACIVSLFFLLTLWFGWATEIAVTSTAALFMYVTVGIATIVFADHAPRLAGQSALKRNTLVFFSAMIAIMIPSWLFIEGILVNLHKAWYLQSFVQWIIVMALGGIVYGVAVLKAKRRGVALEERFSRLPRD